ncbi:alpha-taxilin-like isoform X2 [Lineus longissimus]
MDQQETNEPCEPSVPSESVATEPAVNEAPEQQLKPENEQQEEGEKVETSVSEGAEDIEENKSQEEEECAASELVSNDIVEVNGSPPQEGSAEEEEDSVEDDVVKVQPVQKEPEPIPVIDTSASKVKEQKKPYKKESKSKAKSRDSGKSKDKKKEDKSIEHVLKALSSLTSPEEKLAALCKKYTELLEEHKTVQAGHKQSQKQVTQMMREKEQLQFDHSKALLAKSKMENLCRELQKHNKLIKEESLARVKDEEEKRREVANRFQTTITDIQSQMQDNYSKNTKLREENIELATRLKDLVGNYEKAQTQVEKVFNQNLTLAQEKEKDCKEKQLLFLELEQSQKKVELLEMTEQQLRTQLALYTDKYEDFQSTLQKSNDVFNTFKGEMEKMSKKIKKLEKETMVWKTRCENSNKVCLEMAEEKQRRDQEMVQLQSKNQKLEKLCRALQVERNTLKSGSSSRGASPCDSTKDASPALEETCGGTGNGTDTKPEDSVPCESNECTAEQTITEQNDTKTDKSGSDPEVSSSTAEVSNEMKGSCDTVVAEENKNGNGSNSASISVTNASESSEDKDAASSDSTTADKGDTSNDSGTPVVPISDGGTSVATDSESSSSAATSSESATSVAVHVSQGQDDGEGSVSDVD